MFKSSFRRRLYPVVFFIITMLGIISGCSKQEGFAIYLTGNDIPPSRMEALSHITLADEPIFSSGDVITYNSQTHEIKLTAAAFERLLQLEVPVQGKSFLVCVGKQPIYWGAFWTPVSSISFDGVTIWKPMLLLEPYVITLELGYPSSSFYSGGDPRNNQDIINSLDKDGKLIDKLTISTVAVLPAGFKGYELYSWLDKGEWHFNLITGTNRTKTLDEIVYSEDYISETGWVNIHTTGFESIKTVLCKLRQGENIYWLPAPLLGQAEPENINFGLPQEIELDSIKEYAIQQGLNLHILGE